MTKKMMIIAVTIVVLVSGGVFMWSTVTSTLEDDELVLPIEAVIAPYDVDSESDANYINLDDANYIDLDDDVTRIIIDKDSLSGGEIEGILSKKVIVNDEVKDEVKDEDGTNLNRSL